MTCDECEALVIAQSCGAHPQPHPELEGHLAGCEGCRSFFASTQEVVQLASLPPLTEGEQAELHSLASCSLHAWRQKEYRRLMLRRVVGWAAAAAVGGAVVWFGLQLPRSGTDSSLAAAPAPADTETEIQVEQVLNYGTGESLASFDYAGLSSDADFDDPTQYEIPWTY